jgi:hypothetical protein
VGCLSPFTEDPGGQSGAHQALSDEVKHLLKQNGESDGASQPSGNKSAHTLALPNIEPPAPENGGSLAGTPNKWEYWLGTLVGNSEYI